MVFAAVAAIAGRRAVFDEQTFVVVFDSVLVFVLFFFATLVLRRRMSFSRDGSYD